MCSSPSSVSSHPLVQHKLAALRDVRTPPADFRRAVRTLAVLLAQEATLDLPGRSERSDDAAGARARHDVLEGRRRHRADPPSRPGDGRGGHRASCPRPRSGTSASSATRPRCDRGSITTSSPAGPASPWPCWSIPMLATGGSAVHACEIIKAAGVPRLKLLSLIAAPEGIALMSRAMPDVPIHVGAVDERLNEVGFIYPGLGDAGDRQFGTGDESGAASHEPSSRDRRFARERGSSP